MSDPGAEPRLVVPEGLVIDETARERLERQLALAPPAVSGIAAESAELAPGASYRVHAEWTALESPWSSSSVESPAGSGAGPVLVRGAVLVRPQVEFVVRDGRVEVTDGMVLVDPGAHVHDPFRAIGPLLAASERGRPAFPRRPVVVFLGCEPGGDADWVRRLVNRLVRRDVEARIAMPEPFDAGAASGLQLTRPCLAGEETIRALAPDIVVTLDDTAAARIDAWCAGDRSTVVIAFDETLDDPMELVSWQIGRAAGRLRARIGPRVDVPAFAALVGRLCAGPHPIAPSDEPLLLGSRIPVREDWTSRTRVDARLGCVVLTGALTPPASARVAGLADNLEASGIPVEVASCVNTVPVAARDATTVLLVGVAATPEVDALIANRRRSGLPTVVDLGTDDIDVGASDAEARLTPSAASLVDACGLVVSPAGALHSVARGRGRSVLVCPTLLTRKYAAALRDARLAAKPGAALVIGWRIGSERGSDPAYAAAVADGIASILQKRPDRVVIASDAEHVPTALRGHERVTVVPDDGVDAAALAEWAVQLWTPVLFRGDVLGDARAFEEASSAGVPSIMPAGASVGVDGFVSPFVLVESEDRTEGWVNALHHVLDDPGVRAERALEASRRADAVNGLAASKAVVSRFVGWASFDASSDRVGA